MGKYHPHQSAKAGRELKRKFEKSLSRLKKKRNGKNQSQKKREKKKRERKEELPEVTGLKRIFQKEISLIGKKLKGLSNSSIISSSSPSLSLFFRLSVTQVPHLTRKTISNFHLASLSHTRCLCVSFFFSLFARNSPSQFSQN